MKSKNKITGQIDLAFVKEKGRWYVDLPEFIKSGEGTKEDLEMVLGADRLCDVLADGESRVEVTISTSAFTGADFSIKGMNNGRIEGRDYEAYKQDEFLFTIWLCPVLHYVMGDYPDTIFFKKHEPKQKTKNMKKQRTIYQIILDRSGSMSDCIENTISGFNEQVSRVRKLEDKFPDQEIVMGLSTFSHEVEHHLKLASPYSIPNLTTKMYKPSGNTALLDAIGLTTMMLEEEIGKDNNVETTCVVVILTDGHENSSRYYSLQSIREKITKLEVTEKWVFSFIGATLDAVAVAEKMNISSRNSFSFDKKDMKHEVWNKLSDSMDEYMAMKSEGKLNLKQFLKK